MRLPRGPVLAGSARPRGPSAALKALVVLLVAAGTLGAVFGGPTLGDHEAIVAQCARHMRLSGDWIVPDYLGTPFFRKPPLPYWLVAAASYLFPLEPRSQLPVTTTAARLPSALAAFGTVLLLWRLASSMIGRRVGMVTAVVAGSSVLFLLYGPNATAEMLLIFCCTWAFLHFWCAVTSRHPGMRMLHMMLFYVAMGLAMLSKGPAPIAVAAIPLAVWWYTEVPLRILARGGPAAWRFVVAAFLRGLRVQTIRVFTKLWLVPGLIVFGLMFVPWMWSVALRHPHAWDLWNWQYWQRAQGRYEDTRVRGLFYYIPVVLGLVLPWLFLMIEAIAAPWLRRYAARRRALLYAGLWALIGIVVMSLMQFKKPYYIGPAVSGLLLLIGFVAYRFYAEPPRPGPRMFQLVFGTWRRTVAVRDARRLGWFVWAALFVAALIGLIAGRVWLAYEMPMAATPLTLIAAGALVLLLIATAAYIQGRGWLALGITAATTIAAFHVTWYSCAGAIERMGRLDKVIALARLLEESGAPRDAVVLWADARPDARLAFYFKRHSTYMVTPEEVVSRMVDRTQGKTELQEMVVERARSLFDSSKPVYLVLDRRHYEQWKPHMASGVRVIGAAADDPDSPGRDWIVISNAAVKAGLASPDRSPTTRPVSPAIAKTAFPPAPEVFP